MKLSDRARTQGISALTAWRWFKAGKPPFPARQLPTGTTLVEEPIREGRTVLSTRAPVHRTGETASGLFLPSAAQKGDVQRLEAFAREQGWVDFAVVAAIGSGLNGQRKKRRLLRAPQGSRIGVEHRDRRAGRVRGARSGPGGG